MERASRDETALSRSLSPWLVLGTRVALGATWLVLGLRGVADPYGGVVARASYAVLSASTADTVVVLVPALQLVLGVALLLGVATRGAGALSVVLAVALGTLTAWRGMPLSWVPAVAVGLVGGAVAVVAAVVVTRAGPGRVAIGRQGGST